MTKKILSFSVAVALSSSLYGYDYNIAIGDQMLGAVVDIKDMSVFDNTNCINNVKYTDYQHGGNDLMYYVSEGPKGSNDLLKLDKGQGFIVNANGNCKITIPEPIAFKGITYLTITSPSGKTWLDRNLGAIKACDKKRSEFTSDSEYEASQSDCFGDYYQWGREADGHQLRNSLTTTTLKTYLVGNDAKYVLNSSSTTYYDWLSKTQDPKGTIRNINMEKTDGTNVCPTGFRVPTVSDFIDEAQYLSVLNFPNNGYRSYNTNNIYGKGSYGTLWTTAPSNNYYATSYTVREDSSNVLNGVNRAEGKAIRCIKASN